MKGLGHRSQSKFASPGPTGVFRLNVEYAQTLFCTSRETAILASMEELIIGEKRYISSKRAAKETGYAKDYIGQLCREGKVPAQLVGRSWYVLETAIKDHKFGSSASDGSSHESNSAADSAVFDWDAPRYEAESVHILPNSVPEAAPGSGEALEKQQIDQRHEQNVSPEALQAAWQDWFAHVGSQPPSVTKGTYGEEAVADHSLSDDVPAETATSEDTLQNLEISDISLPEDTWTEPAAEENIPESMPVPIHAIYEPEVHAPSVEAPRFDAYAPYQGHSAYDPVQARDLPAYLSSRDEVQPQRKTSRKGVSFAIVKVAGLAVAFIMAIVAIAGTGVIDRYVTSTGQASAISGISVYRNTSK